MKKVNLIEILNPLDTTQVDQREFDWVEGKSLEFYYPSATVAVPMVVSLNGGIVDKDARALTLVQPGDSIVVCPLVHGGGEDGGGKGVLRIVAFIALSYVSGGLASGAWGGLGTYTASSIVASAALTVAGGMVINKLLPIEKRKQETSEPTYGIDGPTNTAEEGVAHPVCYGQMRMGGNLIAENIINDGDTQWYHALIDAGEGPVHSLGAVEINDQPITDFVNSGAEAIVDRLGTGNQLPIPWFESTQFVANVGARLTPDWHVVQTTSEVDNLRLNLVYPGGVHNTNGRGNLTTHAVEIQAEYRRADAAPDAPWTPMKPTNSPAPQYALEKVYFQNVNTGTTQYSSGMHREVISPYTPNAAQERLEGGKIFNNTFNQGKYPVGTYSYRQLYSLVNYKLEAATRTALRRTVMFGDLPEAVYDVRVRRLGVEQALTEPKVADTVVWSSMTEVVNEPVAYVHTALVAVRIRLDERINSRPKITYINGGRMIACHKSTGTVVEASSNPAWVAMDMLTSTRFGGSVPLDKFDMPAWRDWADYCDAMGLQFNGVFDSQAPLWDQVVKVMRCGHAKPIRVGTKRSVVIERAELPTMMFSVVNMIPDSFSEAWLPITDRINEIEATYLDASDGFKQKSIRAVDQAAVEAGRSPRPTSVDLMGVTNAQQAWNDVMLALNANRYIGQTCEFDALIDAIACKPGDVILVQHDQPAWGQGGKLEADGTTTTLTLDRPVEMTGPSQVKIHYPMLFRYSGSITSAIHMSDSTRLTLTGYDRAKRVTRFVHAGKEVAILATFPGGVVIEPSPTINTGGYEMYETDAMETRDVSLVSGVTVTLASPLPLAPPQYTNWMFGPVNKVGKPFRVQSITGSHEYERHISCIEYNETIYSVNDAAPTPEYSTFSKVINHVTNIAVRERLVQDANRWKSVVTVSWEQDQPNNYGGSNVYVSRDGAPMVLLGNALLSLDFEAAQGESLKFTVQATNRLGETVQLATSPTATYVVLGQTTPPSTVAGVTHEFNEFGLLLSWTKPTEIDWMATEVRRGVWGDNVSLFSKAELTANLGFLQVGNHTFSLRHVLLGNLYSQADFLINTTVLAPSTPVITTPSVQAKAVTLTWASARTTQPIDFYEVAVGGQTDTFDTVGLRKIKVSGETLTTTLVDEVIGNRRAFVRATDKGGNVSVVGTVDYVTSDIANAKVLTLNTSSQVFKVDKSGNHAPNTITLTAFLGGSLGGTVNWFTSPVTVLGGTGNTRTLDFNSMAGDSVQITASIEDAGTLFSDTTTIFKIREGLDGTSGDAVVAVLSNDNQTLAGDADGNVAFLGGAITTMSVYVGIVDDTANWTFGITTSSPNITATLSGSTVTVTSFAASSTAEWIDITGVRSGYPTQTRRFNLSKVNSAVSYEVQVESVNGTVFHVGQARETMLIAHVFKNGVEVTNLIPASRFRWRRNSYFPQPAPNDDATWNTLYASGYKQVLISVDSVSARATFHCDIFDQ